MRPAASPPFDGADVDLACCAHASGRTPPLIYRALRRDASTPPARGDATAMRAPLVGDSRGYVLNLESGRATRLDVDGVTYISGCPGHASTSTRAFALDARGTPTRRWTLPRLAPLTAVGGREREDGSVTLIAVGGAAIACASASARERARASVGLFRRAASTALSVVRSVVDANAEVGEDAIAYEGEDMEEVSKLKRERVEWHCAFVDAPRRYAAFEYERALDVFAVRDGTHHRVLLFRVIGRSSVRLMCVIKGCRDATFAFDAKRRALVLHRPSVRVVESRPLRDASRVDVSIDARDVRRVLPGDDGIPRLVLYEPGGDRARITTFDDATRRGGRW